MGLSDNQNLVTPFKASDSSQVTPATDTTASRENNTQDDESQHYIITQDDPNEEEKHTQHTVLSSSPPASSQEISIESGSGVDNRTLGDRCKTW